ncbi:uncharacterized protein [Malus domestica]|uniref:uncharacterized protein n=1 Tax=Malus domestica TaxID=3750 RepID=UPI0039749610
MSYLITRRRSVTNVTNEPTPLGEPAATASQVPISLTSSVSVEQVSARRPHRRRREPEPFDHTSSASRVEGEASQPAKKTTRGPNRMLKQLEGARQNGSRIKIVYDPRHCGAATSQHHSGIATSCGVVIRDNCPFQRGSWAKIPEETRTLVRDRLSCVYDLEDISPEAMAYLEGTLATRYKQWKNNFHKLFKQWNDPEIARLHVPMELKDRPEDWKWLCKHFTDPKFVKKSIAGQKARESKTLLHHSGSKPFSYRLEARREEGSMFPEIDMFEEVYVRPNNETTKQLHATMVEKRDDVLHEATSQLPSETPIEDITLPEDVGFQIMTDVLDQNFGRRRGKVVRGMGKARVRETGASSSRSKTVEVNALKEEVTQLRAEGEQMKVQLRAQDERMKAQDEEVRTCVGRVQELVQAIQMAGLQISLPVPHLAPPSTSDPSRPADTQ